jgi:hypothetical protein
MSDARLIERIANADAYPAKVPLPEGIWASEVALQVIERRTEVQTDKRTEVAAKPQVDKRGRRSLALVAGFVAVAALVVAGAIWLFGAGSDSDVTNAPPALDVIEALDAAIVAGDWQAVVALYAEDATYTELDDGFGGHDWVRHGRMANFGCSLTECLRVDWSLSETSSVADPNEALQSIYPGYDWDGEPGITGFDDLATLAMANYARGVTDFYSCTQADEVTVVCDIILQGDAFVSEAPTVTDTFTVEDGLIIKQVYDRSSSNYEGTSSPDFSAIVDYQTYVEENADPQGLFGSSLGVLRINPTRVETHKQLIAEWRAQRDG